MMERLVLLNPGPVNVTEGVRAALHRGDMCHREPEITALIQGIRRKLLEALEVPSGYRAALITGSGTAALEMGVASCLSPGRSLLVIQNGVYGERIAAMAAAYQHPKVVLDLPWGQPPSPEEVDRLLSEHPEIEVVALVHHETTTGLLNPLSRIYELCERHGKRLLVDAISSLGGELFDFTATPADLVIGTANKCLQGYPGVSFVLVRDREQERLAALPPRSLYLNLSANLRAQEKGETLFTPAVQVHYALDQALDELIEETLAGRRERYRRAAEQLRRGFREMDLEFLLPEPCRSNTLTALRLPEGVSYGWLHDRLREQGFVIYAGQGGLSKTIFRIANMGDIRPGEFDRLLQALRSCLTQTDASRTLT